MSQRSIPAFMYGTAWKKDETSRLVELAVENGFRAIDTANQPKHYNEPAVGDALTQLAKRGIGRDHIFLQTKFTPIDGQDHRIPYDPEASLTEQVQQSFTSSLEHLKTDWLDSWLLHGPYTYDGLGQKDWEVWRAMEEIHASGRVKHIGISNVSARQISELAAGAKIKPTFVQNRCYASRGWDVAAREECKKYGIIYQGFSLLTANVNVIEHPYVQNLARELKVTPAQIIFRFSHQIGMLPLTGTTNPTHMQLDLASKDISLTEEQLKKLEYIQTGAER